MRRKSLRARVLDLALLMIGGLLWVAAAGGSLDAQLRALRSEDAQSRGDAARALGELGDSRAVLPLLAATADTVAEVRKACAEALAALGEPLGEVIRQSLEGSVEARRELVLRRDPRAIDPLVRALSLRHARVRAAAAEALVSMGGDSVPALRQALTSSDQEVRALVAGVLAEVGGPSEVEPLIAALGDTSADVRAQAASALGAIGDLRAVSGLLAVMGDRYDQVRNAAAAALTMLGEPLGELIRQSLEGSVEARRELASARDPRAIEPLLRAVETHDAAVREASMASLVEMAAAGVEGAVAALEDAADDPHAAVRASALAGLGRQRNASDVDGLVDALADRDPEVRQAAARALGEIGDRRAVERLMEQLGDAHSGVRAAVASALTALGEPSGELVLQVLEDSATARAELARRADPRAIGALLRLGVEGSPPERLAVARTLEMAPWPAAVPALIASLEHDRDADMRATVARALGTKGDARAIEPLLLALVDLSEKVRGAALESLEQLGEPLGGLILKALDGSQLAREELASRSAGSPDARVTPVLIKALEAADLGVRVGAAWTLWALPDARAVGPLIDSVQARNGELRLGAVGALGAIGERAAVNPLRRSLSDLDVRVRRTAAWGLGRIGAPEAVPALLEALNDPDADTRELAVVALGVVADEASRAGLRRALGDPSPHVRAAAQRVLSDPAQHDAGSTRSRPRD